jgi:hypothetical protein
MSVDLIREDEGQHLHWCPGCKSLHVIPGGSGWTFNGDFASPTFTPSVKHSWYPHDHRDRLKVCHYFIRAGEIQFCGDSTHTYAGQTLPLVNIAEALAARDLVEAANG